MIRLEGLSNDPGGKQRSFVWFGTLQCPFALHYEVSEGIAPPVPSWDERSSILPLFHFVAHFQRAPDRTVLRGTNVVANGLCHSKGTLLDLLRASSRHDFRHEREAQSGSTKRQRQETIY